MSEQLVAQRKESARAVAKLATEAKCEHTFASMLQKPSLMMLLDSDGANMSLGLEYMEAQQCWRASWPEDGCRGLERAELEATRVSTLNREGSP